MREAHRATKFRRACRRLKLSGTCYLAGHNRPVHEVLFSRDRDLRTVFENEFQGMTRDPASLERLEPVWNRLRKELRGKLTAAHRRFLFSVLDCDPEWDLIQLARLKDMPAVRWKIQNLQKLKASNPRKFSTTGCSLTREPGRVTQAEWVTYQQIRIFKFKIFTPLKI
jgi:hypothetical protein